LFKAHSLLRYGIFIPLLALILYTPWSSQIDLSLSHQFYQNGQFQSQPYLHWIYHEGIIPGWILTGSAALGLILSYVYHRRFKQWRKSCILIVLTLMIGSGLMVHLVFKDHWGRPRPRQTIEFGGTQTFRAFYEPNIFHQPEPSKSFTCGHCTMGFVFFSLMLIGMHYRKKSLTVLGLGLALLLGGLLGYARLAQGGHFFSDVVISALIMWWTSLLLYQFFLKHKSGN